MNYILLGIAAVLLTLDFCCNKLYQQKAGDGIVESLCYNMFVGIFTGVIFAVIHLLTEKNGRLFTPYSLILASFMAVLGTTYLIIGFKMLKAGMMASYTLFLMTGGMTVPYIWGVFALNEEISVFRVLGLFLILGGVYFSNFSKGKTTVKYLGMGSLVFFMNGLVSVVSKMHQMEQIRETVSTASFVMISGIVKACICVIVLIIMYFHGEYTTCRISGKKDSINIIRVMAASALIGGLSYLFQLVGAKNLPATVLYPMITGGAIVGTAIAGRSFFDEKIEKMTVIGIILCFTGTCCFL